MSFLVAFGGRVGSWHIIHHWWICVLLVVSSYITLVSSLFGLRSSLCPSSVPLYVASTPWKLHFPGFLVHCLPVRFTNGKSPMGTWEHMWPYLSWVLVPCGQLLPCFQCQDSALPRQSWLLRSGDTIFALCPSSPKSGHIFLIFNLYLCLFSSFSKTSVTRFPFKISSIELFGG